MKLWPFRSSLGSTPKVFCTIRTVVYADGSRETVHDRCDGQAKFSALKMTAARVVTQTGHWVEDQTT